MLLCIGLSACAGTAPVEVEYYKPAYRQLAPEPVYSRLIWSHLPGPARPQASEEVPLFLPIISFELGETTLNEAIEALAQTMGYRWHYPKEAGKKVVRLKMEGSVEEILSEIGRQAGMEVMFDHERRLVVVVERDIKPRLPGM